MNKKGFALINVALFIAIAAIGYAAAYPYILQSVKYKISGKISSDAISIVDAADVYYGMNCHAASVVAPTVQTLKNQGLLKGNDIGVNPWGGNFVVSYVNSKTMRATIVVKADFGTPTLASFVKAASRDARVNGTTVEWVRIPTIINDVITVQAADEQGLFGSRPCYVY